MIRYRPRRDFSSLLLLLIWLTTVNTCFAQIPAFTNPDKAGPGFDLQGEYVGLVGGRQTIGIQVIDTGKGQFEGVLYSGGLPGAGWDLAAVFHIKGKLNEHTATFVGAHGERLMFSNANFEGTIEGAVFQGTARMFANRLADVSFRLDKVQRQSPTLGAKPPATALVLFDGSDVEQWRGGTLVDGQLLNVGTSSKQDFGNIQLHMEFRCPHMPTARGMQRGNSGVYLKHEWEIQILDSFGWHHENRKFERLSKFGRCGGIHEMVAPLVNMSFPPLCWQTYDIEFRMARLNAAGERTSPAWMTVRHNGVVIHDRYILPEVPPGRDISTSKDGKPGPIFLQDHGNPVRFRNIWVVEKD
jgi:hypothetical protein